MKPSFATAARIIITATMIARTDASSTARLVALSRYQRQDRRRDHRSQRGMQDQHQDPRRAERRITEQAQDRRLQPVIGGSPASSAYAMPCGTSRVVSRFPAMTSLTSQRRR